MNKPPFVLTMLCLCLYTLTPYGGVRAPDAEIVFRVGENLADGNGFGVTTELEAWKGFGVARGKDSILYSVYPPGESVALVPFILAARWINTSGWYENKPLPLSHYVNDGFRKMFYRTPEPQLEPHALRFLCSLFNILAATLGVLIFYGILFVLTQSETAALFVSLLYAFGTLIWSYAGTFFSEPLLIVCVLGSFYLLVTSDGHFIGKTKPIPTSRFVLSGVMLGLALFTHTNSAMLAPFFAFYAWQLSTGNRSRFVLWLAGYSIFALLLGYFNWFRFGNFLETGRGLSEYNPVDWALPISTLFWKDLFGLLIGTGKGLFLFCPAVLLGFLTWKTFHRKHRSFSLMLLAMIGFVVLVAASYQYWHGGFCMGPRYLLMVIPFMLIPSAFWIKEKIEFRLGKTEMLLFVAMFSFAVIQQLYFCVGEIFSFYHIMKWTYISKGVDIFINDRVYLDWKLSPLHQLLDFERGPFLLHSLTASNQAVWLSLSAVIPFALIRTMFYYLKKQTSRKT